MRNVVIDTNVIVSAAKAEYIISGDNHLLKLKEFKGIKIAAPAEFVKLMKY